MKIFRSVFLGFCASAIMCSIAHAKAYRDAVKASKPTAYFQFEEASVTDGTTTVDAVGSGKMTYKGKNFASTAGVVGKALLFDGSGDYHLQSHGDYLHAPSTTGTGIITVEYWMNTKSNSASQGTVSWAGAGNASWDVMLHPQNGFNTYIVENTWKKYNCYKHNYQLTRAGGEPKDNLGKWYHIVLQIDLNQKLWEIYVNGVKVGSASNPKFQIMAPAATKGLTIGMRSNGKNPMCGAIDELAIYDRLLKKYEIVQHYTAGAKGNRLQRQNGTAKVVTTEKCKSNSTKSKNTEAVEWCRIRVHSARSNDKPRILLVGDSITCAYFPTVVKHLKGKAYCTQFATSLCVADPAFHKQLELVLGQYKYDVIHFNNGLHEFIYTPDEYRAGCEKALSYIKRKSPSAKIILVLSTPLKAGSGPAKQFQKSLIKETILFDILQKSMDWKLTIYIRSQKIIQNITLIHTTIERKQSTCRVNKLLKPSKCYCSGKQQNDLV